MVGTRLHPTADAKGVWLFDEDEVEQVAREVALSGRALEPLEQAQDEPNDDTGPWSQPFEQSDRGEELEQLLQEAEERTEAAERRASTAEAELQRLRARQRDWRSDVDAACALLIASMPRANDELLEAVSALEEALNRDD